jgi:hypothetical protein
MKTVSLEAVGKKLRSVVLLSVMIFGLLLIPAGAQAGWEWQNPLPQGNDLNAVWGSGSNDVFAVGDYGTILHYDGTKWTIISSGTTEGLYAIWGSGSNDIFAVGSRGKVLHYNGSAWTTMTSGINYNRLYGVWGSGPNDVFAVGEYGTILHYNGTKWTIISSGTTEDLYGIWGSGPNDVFTVGGSGAILHYNGTTWSAVPMTSLPWDTVWGHTAVRMTLTLTLSSTTTAPSGRKSHPGIT